MPNIGITYKFTYKLSLYSEIPAVYSLDADKLNGTDAAVIALAVTDPAVITC
jgi:hypothetical protein